MLLGQGQLQLLQLGQQFSFDGALQVFFQVVQQHLGRFALLAGLGGGQYFSDGGGGVVCGTGVGQSLSGG
ncbi:hypothetical protein ACQYWY_00770 [Comamonas sediminis]|uniref:hypothetical protein n=1 Tax=Comamonas sediminis TaxID=1783360 RepID=UPI003D29623D